MKTNYRIGLDIGVASVGWAVLENDEISENPTKILELGVRTFNPNEVAKTGESTAKTRREKRGNHRRTRRRHLRMQKLRALFAKNFQIENLQNKLNDLLNVNIYELRTKALDEKISDVELCKIVLNIAKRRGFKSSRKSESKEEGVLLGAIQENSKFIKEKGYRTIGEAIFKDEKFRIKSCEKDIYNVRNHDGDYKNCFSRDDLIEEIKTIFCCQQNFGNKNISQNFIEQVIGVVSRQRSFDEGPGEPSPYSAKFEVANCTFLPQEKRAPKASFSFEYFSALSKINSLKLNEENLSLKQKQTLYRLLLEKKEIKYEQIRKILNIPKNQVFNFCNYIKKKNTEQSEEEIMASCEKSVFVSMKCSYEIRTKLGLDINEKNVFIIDEVAKMLSLCKSESTINDYIEKNEILKQLKPEQIEMIKTLNFDKFGSLSQKAMQKIIPNLLKGERYDVACKNAGFSHSTFEHQKMKYLKGEVIEQRLKDVTSNVVKRAVNQALRILNEIIKKYGSPQFVSIELARELSKDLSERNKIKRRQEENYIKNENAKQELVDKFKLEKASHFDVVKYKLYEEQNGKCMYSGKEIDINRLFEPNYVQVDHILPYSRSMNDSYNNKVLVLCSENQNKGNQTPYEFFGDDEVKWNAFVSRVNLLKNIDKKRTLLKQKFGNEQEKEFIERNLNDTKYIATFMKSLIKDYLQTAPNKKYKEVIRCVSGSITSYLRKCWGVNKLREDGDIHHAIDAAIISTVTGGQIIKITKYNQFKENFITKDDKIVNKRTGEVITEQEKQDYEKEGIELLSKHLPMPYENFVKELGIRSQVKYFEHKFSEIEKQQLIDIGYETNEIEKIKPVFISKMKNVKTTGAIHQETMMSSKNYDLTKKLIKTVALSSLKVSKTDEKIFLKGDKYPNYSIENYYNPQDDRLLYLKIKEQLVENGGISGEFFKPRKDGTNGPIVKSVKVYEKTSSCVITKNGAAANDKMHRVDVFKKEGKFYLCPVYMADVYAKKLPNKVIEIGKDWTDIDDGFEFLFSLYQNDLIKVSSKREIVLSRNFKSENSNKHETIKNNEFLLYYNSTGISGANMTLKTHDNCYKIDSLGVKTLKNIEKYYVDIMGNIYKAPKEERKGF